MDEASAVFQVHSTETKGASAFGPHIALQLCEHMANQIQMEPEEPTSGNSAFSPLSILRTIWKRKIRIGVVWFLGTVCALVVVHQLQSIYLSEAVVLIDSQKIPEKFVSPTVASDLQDRIASIRQMLLSSSELKKVIDEFGLYKEQRKSRFEEEILEMMRKDISITLESMTSGLTSEGGTAMSARPGNPAVAFRIGYQGPNPQLVTRVANRLTDLYVEQNLKTRESQAAGTSEFLETQLREAKKRLDELEAAVSAYKLQHNGELPQQEQSLGSALSRLQIELEANRDAINRAQQTRVILESNLNAMGATLSAQVQAQEQAQRAATAEGAVLLPGETARAPKKKTSEMMQEQLEILRTRYTENHPEAVRLKADIEKVKRLEEQQEAADRASAAESDGKTPAKEGEGVEGRQKTADVGSAADAAVKAPAKATGAGQPKGALREPPDMAHTREMVASLSSQIMGADKEIQNRSAEQQRIVRDIDTYQRRIERLPVREQEMAQITRDYEMSKANYKSLLDKKIAAEMALDMERRQQSERFTVLDRAQVPERPIKPKRPMLYGAGAGLALALALLLAFSAELRKNVVLGEWELPEGTPVLARLPYIEVAHRPEEKKPRARRGWFGRKKALREAAVSL